MKAKSIVVAAVLSVCGAATAWADHPGRGRGHAHHGHGPVLVSARVIDVEPVTRYVTVNRPREECWNEIVREPVRPYGAAGSTLAGSIIGAAIGRQFGSGNDRDALTVIGAVAGGAVAHQRAVRNGALDARDVAVQRCAVVNDRVTERIVDGYLVSYRYEGRTYTMRTDRHPGDWVRVAVDVRPVGYRVRY